METVKGVQMKIEEVARITYEALLAVRIMQGKESRQHWENASEFHRNVHIDGVRWCLDNPTTDPVEAHDKWIDLMIRGGRQDDEDVKHLMVPFSELDAYEQIKDILFLQIVNSMRSYIERN